MFDGFRLLFAMTFYKRFFYRGEIAFLISSAILEELAGLVFLGKYHFDKLIPTLKENNISPESVKSHDSA
jgi:hypothetical protein